MDSTVYQNMKKDQERSSGTLPDLFLLICDVSVLLEIDQPLPFSVAFATGALDIAFILQSGHGAFDGSQRSAGLFLQFSLGESRVLCEEAEQSQFF